MFLTIGIPVYNVKLYLKECLESILNQTEKDFEIILVDDGSTDDSSTLCDTYASNYPNVIRVIHKNHSGPLLARRICLAEAKGLFIYLMDADDKLIAIDTFEKVRKVIQQTNCDMVLFEMTRDLSAREAFLELPFNHMESFEGSKRKLLYELFVSGNSMNSLCHMIFSRNLLDFDTDYSIYNNIISTTDAFQALPIVSNANKIVIIKEVFYYYRKNDGSITRSFNINYFESLKAYILRLEEFLNRWNVLDDSNIMNYLCIKKIQCCQGAIAKLQFSESIFENRKEYIEYLKDIAESSLFKENIRFASELTYKGKVLVFLLRWRMYNIILLLIASKKFISRAI